MTEKAGRKYEKPVINKVNLVPEEAVLTMCKTGAAEDKGGAKVCAHPASKCPDVIGS